eukprot:COSAG02_NODE_5_length_66751_cov_63.939148_41_plen_131_part_00
MLLRFLHLLYCRQLVSFSRLACTVMNFGPSTRISVCNKTSDWLPRECIPQLGTPSYPLNVLALLLLLILLMVLLRLLTLIPLDLGSLVAPHHLLQRECRCRTRSRFELPVTRPDPSRQCRRSTLDLSKPK